MNYTVIHSTSSLEGREGRRGREREGREGGREGRRGREKIITVFPLIHVLVQSVPCHAHPKPHPLCATPINYLPTL